MYKSRKGFGEIKKFGPQCIPEFFVYASYFKNNDLFSNDEISMKITLYSNEWETAKLLGTSKKKHKLAAFYRTQDTYYHTTWDV